MRASRNVIVRVDYFAVTAARERLTFTVNTNEVEPKIKRVFQTNIPIRNDPNYYYLVSRYNYDRLCQACKSVMNFQFLNRIKVNLYFLLERFLINFYISFVLTVYRTIVIDTFNRFHFIKYRTCARCYLSIKTN